MELFEFSGLRLKQVTGSETFYASLDLFFLELIFFPLNIFK